jgi:hypothetical protein
MQTGTHVIVNIYCKKPDPTNESLTYVEVNPIRLRVRINLLAGGPSYNSDIELRGVSTACLNCFFYESDYHNFVSIDYRYCEQ